MNISELSASLINQGLLPSNLNESREELAKAILELGLQESIDFKDQNAQISTEYESRIRALLERSKKGSTPNVSTAIARSKSEPRPVGTPHAIIDEPGVDFSIPADLELAIAAKAQVFAAELCRIYRTHAVSAARQGIADVNASIMESLK